MKPIHFAALLAFLTPVFADPPTSSNQAASTVSFSKPDSGEEVFDQKIIDWGLSQVGVLKQVGYESPRVKQYVESTDQEADEYYSDGWCNAFVSADMLANGYEYMSLNSTDQVGFFFHEVTTPKIGDIVLLSGHIAIYFGKANLPGYDNAVMILGGNQAHAVNVLPVAADLILGYYEPIKAPAGWKPSRHLSADSMSSYNRLDDNGWVSRELEKTAKIH